jgi:hypothetical protein
MSAMFVLLVLLVVIALCIWGFQLLSRTVSNPSNYYIGPSQIEGDGVMTARDFKKDEFVETVVDALFGSVTKGFGRMINHSNNPTIYLKYANSTYDAFVIDDIPQNTELTLDYNENPWHLQGPEPHYV